jgi:hypothetical protein
MAISMSAGNGGKRGLPLTRCRFITGMGRSRPFNASWAEGIDVFLWSMNTDLSSSLGSLGSMPYLFSTSDGRKIGVSPTIPTMLDQRRFELVTIDLDDTVWPSDLEPPDVEVADLNGLADRIGG